MPRYIDAEILTKAIENRLNEEDEKFAFGHDACEILSMIYAMEDADVAPVVHGEWVDADTPYFGTKQKVCSNCKNDEYWKKYFCHGDENYCPNCGAKMDGGIHDKKHNSDR